MSQPSEPYREFRMPISIKGVVIQDSHVLLLENERQEWELPGGKLEEGESPKECVEREILEETQWQVRADAILNAWPYTVFPGRTVFVVSYGCVTDARGAPIVSTEHKKVGLFRLDEIPALNMPDGYKEAVLTWFKEQ